ncbi:MAG: hypothetical protein WCK89_16230 [bacterium]
MKKTVVAAFAAFLLVGVAQAAELVALKKEYEVTATNPVQRASFVANRLGGADTLALLESCGWDSARFVNAMAAKEAPAVTSALHENIHWRLPAEDKVAWVHPLARALGKRAGIGFALTIPKAAVTDGVFSNVFELADLPGEVYRDTQNIGEFALKTSVERKRLFAKDDLRPADYVRFMLNGGPQKSADDVAYCKRTLIAKLEKAAKKKLRDEGKTFVTRNGVNPLEVALRPVVAALNAPRLEGIEAALAAFDILLPAGARSEKVWAAVEAYKGDIFSGERPADPGLDGAVVVMLGPDGYNAWVKEFNEGTATP